MADTSVQIIDTSDGDRIQRLYKDVGNSQHAQAVVVVDSAGAAVGGGSGITIALTPTISASPDYTALDVAGGILTFSGAAAVSGRPVRIRSLCVKDKGGQAPAFTLLLFKQTPASGTYTDNGALTLGTNDLANCVASISVVTGDYYTPVSGAKVATLSGLDIVADVDATDLFGLIIVDSTSWNAGSTSDITLELGIERL